MDKKSKNAKSFQAQKKDEKVVLDGKKKVVGTVIIKPSGVGWKKANAKVFKFVTYEVLADLMENDDRTKSIKQ